MGSEFSNCENLEHFLLNNNRFHGTIPPWLGKLQKLGEIDLSYNNLSGMVPAELGNCSRLLKLYLQNNNLSGEIPPEIGNLAYLNVLNMKGNKFSGKIPSTIQQCKKIYELRLSDNNLSGSIPFELGKLTELQVILDLSNNLFSGKIPSILGALIKLERLNLSLNHLQGEVPTSLGKLTSLHTLNLSNNHLQGHIPSSFSTFPKNAFSGNSQLCGAPLDSCSSVHLEKKWLSEKEVAGIIVAIVFTSTLICLVMLYIMLRLWNNWRTVPVSNSDNGLCEHKKDERWDCGEDSKKKGEYWKLNTMALVPSQDKQSSPKNMHFPP